jgi:hypothetical protein
VTGDDMAKVVRSTRVATLPHHGIEPSGGEGGKTSPSV